MPNPTIEKFGYLLGSLVLAATSDATAYGDLPAEAFAEQGRIVADIERALAAFSGFERINYLMLMMVDPNVHFHVIPRYSGVRSWQGTEFADAGWPGLPDLKAGPVLDAQQISALAQELRIRFAQAG